MDATRLSSRFLWSSRKASYTSAQPSSPGSTMAFSRCASSFARTCSGVPRRLSKCPEISQSERGCPSMNSTILFHAAVFGHSGLNAPFCLSSASSSPEVSSRVMGGTSISHSRIRVPPSSRRVVSRMESRGAWPSSVSVILLNAASFSGTFIKSSALSSTSRILSGRASNSAASSKSFSMPVRSSAVPSNARTWPGVKPGNTSW